MQPPPAPSPGSQDSRDSSTGAGGSLPGQNSQPDGYPPGAHPPGKSMCKSLQKCDTYHNTLNCLGQNYPSSPNPYPGSAPPPPPPPGGHYPPPPRPSSLPGSEQYPGYNATGSYPSHPGWPPGGYPPPPNPNGTATSTPSTMPNDSYNRGGWMAGQPPPTSQSGYGSPRYPPPPSANNQSQPPYSQPGYPDQYQVKISYFKFIFYFLRFVSFFCACLC